MGSSRQFKPSIERRERAKFLAGVKRGLPSTINHCLFLERSPRSGGDIKIFIRGVGEAGVIQANRYRDSYVAVRRAILAVVMKEWLHDEGGGQEFATSMPGTERSFSEQLAHNVRTSRIAAKIFAEQMPETGDDS